MAIFFGRTTHCGRSNENNSLYDTFISGTRQMFLESSTFVILLYQFPEHDFESLETSQNTPIIYWER